LVKAPAASARREVAERERVGVGPQAQVRNENQMHKLNRLTTTIAIIAVTVSVSGCSYNKFSTQEEAINAQWAEVQNQLQRRTDLIPNLVNTVKGYAAHESSVFQAIADARSRLLAAKSPEETIQAANQQTSALGRLLAVVENYPQLKADAQFTRLMDELAGTENRLTVARMRYNEAVQAYNTQRRRFPSNVTAKMFGFKEHPYWEVPPEAKQAPKVDFGK
jgi:LemA protein